MVESQRKANDSRPLTYLDLFSGCGGFSLGLEWAGLKCLAAIDFNESAIGTYRANNPSVPHALVKDLTKFPPTALSKLLGKTSVDVIVGGPPCQGFSKARHVDGANHGERLVDDPRRHLYREFLKYVSHFQPSMFVMENVPGIRSAVGGEFFTKVQVESRKLGYRVIPYEVKAWRFGVPQKRVRQLLIGTQSQLPVFVPEWLLLPTHGEPASYNGESLPPPVTLGEAIGDLPEIEAGDERILRDYDLQLRRSHIQKYGKSFICDVLQCDQSKVLSGHAARPHSARDLRDFARLREGETSKEAIERGVKMEFPYNRDSFKDRYTRQHRNELCSTIVAHLKKDGLMFIHPTQLRSLTPREAARIQTFPDTFVFPAERTNAFEQIGNAVPPLVGKAVGIAVLRYLRAENMLSRRKAIAAYKSSKKRDEIISQIEAFVEALHLCDIKRIPKAKLIKAWSSIRRLLPHLHPDAAFDNGKQISRGTPRGVSFVLEPHFIRSGWPVELVPIVRELRRRVDEKQISSTEYYGSEQLFNESSAA